MHVRAWLEMGLLLQEKFQSTGLKLEVHLPYQNSLKQGLVKCIIEMQELGTRENASRIKQGAFHLSDIAATSSSCLALQLW